jgi:nucleotide-binding universal stress UspA family protein
MIGLNKSAASQRALKRAIDLAGQFEATLTAVAVVPAPPPYAAYAAALSAEAPRIMEGDQQAFFVDLLGMARREAAQHAIEIETVLSGGSAVVSVFDAVRTNQIDLLVLGIQPELELLGWMSGSTAHELAQRVACDVLGVH